MFVEVTGRAVQGLSLWPSVFNVETPLEENVFGGSRAAVGTLDKAGLAFFLLITGRKSSLLPKFSGFSLINEKSRNGASFLSKVRLSVLGVVLCAGGGGGGAIAGRGCLQHLVMTTTFRVSTYKDLPEFRCPF